MTDVWLMTYDFAWFNIIFDTVCFNPQWDPIVFDFFICVYFIGWLNLTVYMVDMRCADQSEVRQMGRKTNVEKDEREREREMRETG